MPIIVIALLVAAALGGGVSAAANSSLPGNALYSFKVDVNENVEGAFAFSDTSKADWDIGAMQSRLNEAQTLAAQGKLDTQAQAEITSNFDTHVANVKAEIAQLEAKGDYTTAANVAAKFQGTLAQEESSITTASANVQSSTKEQVSLAPFLVKVRTTLSTAASLSTDASAKVAASSTVQDLNHASTNSNGPTNSNTTGSVNVNAGASATTGASNRTRINASSTTNTNTDTNVETPGGVNIRL